VGGGGARGGDDLDELVEAEAGGIEALLRLFKGSFKALLRLF
jgi:hypothetical protein